MPDKKAKTSSKSESANRVKGNATLIGQRTKKILEDMLVRRFWPVILEKLKTSGYSYAPARRLKMEFESGLEHHGSITFMLFDGDRPFFRGQLECSLGSWMIHSEFFLDLPKETEPEVLWGLLGNTRLAGNPPTLIVDKRKAEFFFQMTFHAGNGAGWGLRDEAFVEKRILQVIDTNVQMHLESMDGGISSQDVGSFLTLAYDVYEAY